MHRNRRRLAVDLLRILEHVAEVEVQLRFGQLVLLFEQVLALRIAFLDDFDRFEHVHSHLDSLNQFLGR